MTKAEQDGIIFVVRHTHSKEIGGPRENMLHVAKMAEEANPGMVATAFARNKIDMETKTIEWEVFMEPIGDSHAKGHQSSEG